MTGMMWPIKTICYAALEYLENGKVKVDELVTHEIPLAEYSKALELAWARKGIKIAIIP